MTLLHFHLQKQKFLRRLADAEICVFFDQAKKSHPCGQILSGQDLGKILLDQDVKNLSQLRGRLSLVFYSKFDSHSLHDLQKMMQEKNSGHCLGLLAKTSVMSDSSQVRFDFVSRQDLESLGLRSINQSTQYQEILSAFQQSKTLVHNLTPKLTADLRRGQIFFLSLVNNLANNGN